MQIRKDSLDNEQRRYCVIYDKSIKKALGRVSRVNSNMRAEYILFLAILGKLCCIFWEL